MFVMLLCQDHVIRFYDQFRSGTCMSRVSSLLDDLFLYNLYFNNSLGFINFKHVVYHTS